jgi:hypothetical protein
MRRIPRVPTVGCIRRSAVRKLGFLGAGIALGAAGTAAAASDEQNAHRVQGQITYTNTNTKIRACAGGFDLSSDARLTITSADPRLNGTITGHLKEVANAADDAYVIATGSFRSRSGTYTGSAVLTAVDHGNSLNGVYVIRLAHHAGVIVANTASNQDRPIPVGGKLAGGHGEVGTEHPLAPHNYAVVATSSCSGQFP